MTENEPLRQLSIDPKFAGYRDDAAVFGAWLTISFDGHIQHGVVAYDLDAGELVRCRCDESGKMVVEKDHIALETVRGRIEIAWRRPS